MPTTIHRASPRVFQARTTAMATERRSQAACPSHRTARRPCGRVSGSAHLSQNAAWTRRAQATAKAASRGSSTARPWRIARPSARRRFGGSARRARRRSERDRSATSVVPELSSNSQIVTREGGRRARQHVEVVCRRSLPSLGQCPGNVTWASPAGSAPSASPLLSASAVATQPVAVLLCVSRRGTRPRQLLGR
jgi:hypothetical protein